MSVVIRVIVCNSAIDINRVERFRKVTRESRRGWGWVTLSRGVERLPEGRRVLSLASLEHARRKKDREGFCCHGGGSEHLPFQRNDGAVEFRKTIENKEV
jgi:hypothetical protein